MTGTGTRIVCGTSGFSFAEWKGTFYPEGLAEGAMLSFYGRELPVVEINNTFYRLPSPRILGEWAAAVPETFRFCLKASQRITHYARLAGAKELVDRFFFAKQALGPKAGPSLFQLPPQMKKDVGRLRAFFDDVPVGERLVFELGSRSWFDDEVYEVLRSRGATACIVDDEKRPMTLVRTAPFAYLRLRRPEYTDAELQGWLTALNDAGYEEAFVFFKHEEAGAGPRLAKRMLALAQPTSA